MPNVSSKKIALKFIELQEEIGAPLTPEMLEFLDDSVGAYYVAMMYSVLACAMYPDLYKTFKAKVDCAPKSLREREEN